MGLCQVLSGQGRECLGVLAWCAVSISMYLSVTAVMVGRGGGGVSLSVSVQVVRRC